MRLRLGGHGRRTLKSDRPHQFNFLFATYDQHHRRLPSSSHISQSWPSSWFSVAPLRATLAGLPPSLPPSRSAFRILDSAKHRHSARLHATGLVLTAASPNMLLSGSRDKTLIIWNLTRDETSYGYPKRSLKGHSHIVSDCVRTPGRAPQQSAAAIGGNSSIRSQCSRAAAQMVRAIELTRRTGHLLRRCLRSLLLVG